MKRKFEDSEFIASVDRNIPFRIDAYVPISGLPWRAPKVSEIESLRDQVKTILPNTTHLHGESGKKRAGLWRGKNFLIWFLQWHHQN